MSFVNRTYARLDAAVDRRTGTDLRLLYGFGVPVYVMAVLITLGIAFAASAVTVGALMVVEAVMLVAVAVGFTRLLSEADEDGGQGD